MRLRGNGNKRQVCYNCRVSSLTYLPHFAQDTMLLALFFGARDQPDGSSWCPDTNDAHPVIEAALAAVDGNVTLVEVPLPRAEYKGNAAHWARKHAGVQLQRIPTLYRWGAGTAPVRALVEEQAKVEKLVAELLS